MTAGITLTAAMRANLLSLQGTGKLLDQTQLRLATGNKVNSALDNPINYFAAQSLNQRASSLSALLDGMGQSIQTLKATDQGITTLTTFVKQLKSIANSAKSSLNNATNQEILETAGASGLNSIAVADLTDATSGGNLNAATAVTAGDSFTLQNGTDPVHTFTIDTAANGGVGKTLQEVADPINQVQGFSASIVYGDGSATSAAGGTMAVGKAYLRVVSTTGQQIKAADSSGNPGADNSVIAALGIGATSATVSTGGDAGEMQSYTDVLAQMDQSVTDANYQGNNLIDGKGTDLTVQVNELSTGAITITNVDLTAVAGLGLDADASSWTSSTNIDTAIDKINAALDTLASKAAGFANSLSLVQTRQDFTNNLINTLQDGASQLTIADKNEEGANLLALQTQQQLGIEALSLSSQANQSVLRLFA